MSTPVSRLCKPGHPALRVSPGRSEPMARNVVDFLGGPVGRFAAVGRIRWWTPLRVLIGISLIFLSLAYAQKAACLGGAVGDDGAVSLNWAGNRQYAAACYNDILPLYSGRGLDSGGFVYAFSWQEGDLTRYMEYPVLAGLFQGAVGWLARSTYGLIDALPGAIPEASWYFTLTALIISAIWIVTIRMVVELAGNRVWDVVLVVASPLLIVYGFTNWDLPSVAFVVAAMLLVAKRRPGWAGVMIGLGTAFKLWPLYLFGAYFVLAARSRKWAPFGVMTGTAVVSWLAVNLPVMYLYPEAWREFLRLNSERSWEWTTVYALISRSTGWDGFDSPGGEPVILNAVSLLLFAALCAAIAWLGLAVRRRPRVAELMTLIVVAFLLVNKVWSPQYSLWLLVPAVLALPHWRLIFTWGVVDMALWPVLMWHMMGVDNNGAPGWLLNAFVLGRDGLIVAIAVLVVRQMLGRGEDKVALAHGGTDPLAGSFGEGNQGATGVEKRKTSHA